MAIVGFNGPRAAAMRCARTNGSRAVRRSLLAGAVSLASVLTFASTALAVDEFAVPTPDSRPAGITAGPGGLWFTEEQTSANKIGRITLGGGISEFGGLSPAPAATPPETGPAEIVLGSDGGLWFTEIGANKIGRIDPNSFAVRECNAAGTAPDGITSGPDGMIWFTLSGSNRIGRLNPLAPDPCTTVQTFVPSSGSLDGPGDITPGPVADGRLWFTESGGNRVSAIATNGQITRYPAYPVAGAEPSGITASASALWFTASAANEVGRIEPSSGDLTNRVATGAGPSAITTGPDGALWFTETGANKIGRITTGSTPVLTNEFVIPTPNSQPGGIAVGADNALWFTEFAANKIGRIATAPPFVPTPQPPPVAPPVVSQKKCKVPKLKNLTVKKARSKLKKAGCKYKIRGKGRVRSTSPKAGATTTKRVTVKCKAKKRSRR